MTNWLRNQIRFSLFRKLFVATLVVTMIPVVIMVIILIQNGYNLFEISGSAIFTSALGLVILSVLLAGFVTFYIARYITTPISELKKGATEIARGNFSHQIKVKSEDEIGTLAKLFNYMTTELRRLNNMNIANIIAEKNKTQTIIKNIADGVIVTDPETHVIILNSVAEKWLGLKPGEAVEKPLGELIKESKLLQLIQEATSKRRNNLPSVEIPLKTKGHWKPMVLQARAARVQREDEDLIGVVTILRDITQQKEIDKLKTELVSMVAHELRSPLTSISGFSELLLDPELAQEQVDEYASIILNEANRLSELINKFLDISRIESGRIQPKKEPLDLTEVIQMVVGNNSYPAFQKGIEVEIHGASRLSKIYADSGMMEQVFLNLFSNAVKYSPDNTHIDFVLKNGTDEVIVEIHDQGYGIPEKDLPKIFDKFYRVVDNEATRGITGTGLGLNLVQQIVQMHNGRIEVESEVGKGSVFSVFLPKMSHRQHHRIAQEDLENIVK